MKLWLGAVCAAAMVLSVQNAAAQNLGGSGLFGEVTLNAGFSPDPHVVSMPAGGTVDSAQTIGGRCTGMIGTDPDYVVDYRAGSTFGLYISAESGSDTTLVVYAPDKLYYCDDDSAGSLNPGVYLPTPPAGRYLIWLGTFSSSGGNPPATVYVSEIGYVDALRTQGLVTGAATGAVTIHSTDSQGALVSGFTPDPYVIGVTAGGTIDVSTTWPECRGYVRDSSNYLLTFTGGPLPLLISAASDVDTTLIVEAPDGQVYCDDDSGEGPLNPALNFTPAQTGNYNIWVGTYSSSSAGTPATLHISELSVQ
jgi:hypothetical protein